MKRVFSWLIGLPVAIILIAFAIANREWMKVPLDPFSFNDPWLKIEIPQWILILWR